MTRFYISFAFTAVLCLHQIQAQNVSFDRLLKEKQIHNCLDTLENIDEVNIGNCCHYVGVHYYKNYNFLKALKFFQDAVIIRKEYDLLNLYRTYLNLGAVYDLLQNHSKALFCFREAESCSTNKNIRLKDSYNILSGFFKSYKGIGDFDNAINYALQLHNFCKNEEAYLTKLSEVKVRLCEVYAFYDDTISLYNGIRFADESIQLFHKQIKEKYIKVEDAYNCKAIILGKMENFDAAIKVYEQVYNDSRDTSVKALALNNIGVELFFKYNKDKSINKNSLNKSIQKLNLSLNLYKEYYGVETDYDYSAPHENLADNHTALQQFDTALIHYQKALINLTNNFRTEDIYQNPNPKDSSLFIYSNPDMIRVLHLKATAAYQYYQQNNNPKYLTLANQTYQTAFDFHDKLQQDISTENSRLFQAKNIVPYIENALNVVYQLQENTQNVSEAAFRFMEKNKATVLLQAMNEADALQFANLPDSLLEQEKDLKIALTFHNKQLNEAIEYEEVDEINRINDLLFKEKQQYSQLINSLENNYPDYHRLKYQQNKTELTNVQQSIDKQTALIEYFVGEDAIYILLILKNYTKLYKLKKPTDWKQTIDNLRQSITNIYSYDKMLFVSNARQLSQWLLDSILCDLPAAINRLQIIPDAELNNIPFEVLLTEDVDEQIIQYKKLDYLLKSKSIGYAYSAALWLENKETTASPKTFSYVGYAPEYYGKKFDDLPIARNTVKTLAELLNGKTKLTENAVLPNFLNDSFSSSILHLAMHGVLNDKNPLSSYLAFTPIDSFKLYAYDLYNMKINSDLTILHACNTGTGELQKGEGVMSLSRAFTYAGCPSLVMSLWQIPENATTEITKSFIENLQSGLTKDVALQQAKLSFLKNTTATLAFPAYWAGLVATGNLEAIKFNQ